MSVVGLMKFFFSQGNNTVPKRPTPWTTTTIHIDRFHRTCVSPSTKKNWAMKLALIKKYGNGNDATNYDEASCFRTACINMKMTLSDGIPVPISGIDYLFVGSVGAAYNFERLKAAGITHIINVTNTLENKYPDHFTYLRIGLEDDPDTDISSHFSIAQTFIESVRGQQGKCLVHCYQGISRSVTIVSAYLLTLPQLQLNVLSALDLIRQNRPSAGPNR